MSKTESTGIHNEVRTNGLRLLTDFEKQNIPDPYRGYYEAKRTNFHASLERSPALWRLYLMLDKILLTEFEDLFTASDPHRMLPLSLLFNAHAKIRVSIELAFTRCMEESRSILRDAIESAAFARYMSDDPELQAIWLSKDGGKAEAQTFTDKFGKRKKDQLFKGIPELHRNWAHLSETGAHATPQAIVGRFKIEETSTETRYMVAYTGVDDHAWETETFTMLLTVSSIEKVVFGMFHARLQFDEALGQLRSRMDRHKEEMRSHLKQKYAIEPPIESPTP